MSSTTPFVAATVPRPSNAFSSQQLAERFHPIFKRIAEDALRRENDRALAYEAVGWLRESGFGALRVPIADGGLGASPEQFFDLLIELGEADSNLPQVLRAHFGFIESTTGAASVNG